ncbi:MAG: HlyD family secretion protein [Coleofasciculus sp. S288]|nr:HlyD family secretion protein [Coleofasciculus sp. S288]
MLSHESHLPSLPEVTSDELLPPISRWTMICGLSLVSVVGIAFTLAAIIKYPVKIAATAVVRPVGEIRLVQAPAEAAVKSINANENQLVRKGDVIATLDASPLEIKQSQLNGTNQSNQAQLERIEKQLDTLTTQRNAEEHLSQRAIASAQADLARSQREYHERQITTQTEVKKAQAKLIFAQTDYQRYQQLVHQEAVSHQQRDEKKQAYQIALAELEQVQTSLNPSNALVTIAQERIAQEHAKGKSTLAVLDKERGNLLQRRDELLNQLNRDRKDLKQVEMDIAKYVIRAPETGTLFKLDLRNVGQVVRSAETIAQIAPSDAPLVVKAQVDTQDISKVARNQTVYLQVKAYPYPDYGILTGKVVAIAPDVTQIPVNNSAEQTGKTRASAAYYEVAIQPDTLYLRNDAKNGIQPGMEVKAEIIAKDETVLTFLLRKARLLTDW